MPASEPQPVDACSVGCSIGTQRSTRAGKASGLALAGLAGEQHGVVARRQLLELGFTKTQITGRVQRGHLHAVHRGVYSVGHRVLGVEGRWMAAALAGGPGAALSHRSAAELWQLVPRSGRSIEVTRASGWRAPFGVLIHRGNLPADETCILEGIPSTSMPRTILDLAAVVSTRQLEQAINEAEVRGLTDRLSVPDLLERYPRRPGSAALRALLQDGSAARGIARSELEALFMAILDRTDLPRPRLNADLAVRGRFFEADCLWAEQRLIVELDGRAVHGTDRAFEKDRERDRLLLVEGWRVARITWRQLRDDEQGVIADLRRLLRE
jgi:very-short-patch-repair endonuclease/predicted transcriptional regulator of viral defense system